MMYLSDELAKSNMILVGRSGSGVRLNQVSHQNSERVSGRQDGMHHGQSAPISYRDRRDGDGMIRSAYDQGSEERGARSPALVGNQYQDKIDII